MLVNFIDCASCDVVGMAQFCALSCVWGEASSYHLILSVFELLNVAQKKL